jgi:Putative methyltransferase
VGGVADPDRTDWVEWHDAYRDPGSPLSGRLAIVQRLIGDALDTTVGEVQVISICSGAGKDLLGVLATRDDRSRVHALLVDANPHLVERARSTARANRLEHVRAVVGDAALTDAYAGVVPADVILVCGVFGNIADEDIERTIATLPQLCREGAEVIWTRNRRHPDLTPSVRRWFAAAGFDEVAFESAGPGAFAVGMHRLTRESDPLVPGARLFTFVR